MNTNKKACGCCQTAKAPAQFHKSPLSSNQFLPICKLCCKDKLKVYTEITGSESAAFWLVLSELGVPFIKEVWDKFQVFKATSNVNTDLIMAYLRALSESGIKVDGFWQSDVMLDMLMDSVVDRDVEREELDLTEQQKIWGKFEPEDYEFLNFTFNEYTQDLLDMDANLIRRYRDLAKAELRKRKADESGDIQEVKNAQNILNNQLSLLKLNEFKSHNKTDEQLSFEKRVAMIEYTKPSECEDLKVYLDMVGYEKEKGLMMRSLRNAIAGTRDYPDIPKEELG